MGLDTSPFDAADTLSEEGLDALVADAADSGDPNYLIVVLRTVARGRGMAQVAREAGLSREGLYKALSEDGNPTFATVAKVARALGYQLRLEAV